MANQGAANPLPAPCGTHDERSQLANQHTTLAPVSFLLDAADNLACFVGGDKEAPPIQTQWIEPLGPHHRPNPAGIL
jgi:hypothetical protein